MEATRRCVVPEPSNRQQIDARMLESRVLFSASTMAAALVESIELTADSVDADSHFEQLFPEGQADAFSLFDMADGSDVASEDALRMFPDFLVSDEGSALDEQTQCHELVFVDTAAGDYQQLLDDLLSGGDESRRFEVVLLEATRDGIEQISRELTNHNELDAIHVVSRGPEGAVKLGGS